MVAIVALGCHIRCNSGSCAVGDDATPSYSASVWSGTDASAGSRGSHRCSKEVTALDHQAAALANSEEKSSDFDGQSACCVQWRGTIRRNYWRRIHFPEQGGGRQAAPDQPAWPHWSSHYCLLVCNICCSATRDLEGCLEKVKTRWIIQVKTAILVGQHSASKFWQRGHFFLSHGHCYRSERQMGTGCIWAPFCGCNMCIRFRHRPPDFWRIHSATIRSITAQRAMLLGGHARGASFGRAAVWLKDFFPYLGPPMFEQSTLEWHCRLWMCKSYPVTFLPFRSLCTLACRCPVAAYRTRRLLPNSNLRQLHSLPSWWHSRV